MTHFEFWTKLIQIKHVPSLKEWDSIKGNCTWIFGPYFIFEGDIEVLTDEGIRLKIWGEGAAPFLGGLNTRDLVEICVESFDNVPPDFERLLEEMK